MTVNYEVKGLLAKLLATEDIIVENKKVDTACFNVETRCLTLPLWEKASDGVYDLLVAHECGHSIFTPNIDWTKNSNVPPQFVNIVEDTRVEKLMKRRYGGLSKTFYNGYKELHEEDFFCIGEDDVSTFNLADRVNLYFKIGNFISLDFNSKEKEIIDIISNVETFDEVLEVSKLLYEYTKNEENLIKELPVSSVSVGRDGSENEESSQTTPITLNSNEEEQKTESSSTQDNENLTDGKSDSQSKSQNVQVAPSSIGEESKEPEIRTVKSLEEKIKELASRSNYESKYVEVPEVNLDTIIASNEDVHKEIDICFNHQLSNISSDLFSKVDLEYRKFKISAQKEVGYLVKEFECRKSADAYSRASTSRTGVLDTSKLHTYKFSDDIFKKITLIPDGKNHGLIFILDWSGSMQNILMDTCKQLFNLIWFCKKLSIPFDVYAFTAEWSRHTYDYETGKHIAFDIKKHYKEKEGLLSVNEHFNLMNILTSKVSTSKFEHQMKNFWRIICYFKNYYYTTSYQIPNRLSLSGTPLNESLISLHQIIPQFQSKNKVQKVHTIILTDGEASTLPVHVKITRNNDFVRMGLNGIRSTDTYLRDRKLGTTYKFFSEHSGKPHEFTATLLRNLKDKFPNVSFIGIRVLESNYRYFAEMYHNYGDKQLQVIQNDWKKHKSFTITNSGYHAYFGMSSSSLSQNDEFRVDDNATKSQIKNAFTKSLKTKQMNKKILSEFVSLIA